VNGRVVALLGVSCAVVVAGSCASPDVKTASSRAASTAERALLRPILTPDLSRTSDSLREQIRGRYSSLMVTLENAGATTADLVAAYGEMGKLLTAAEYFDAAEACLLNANALAPNDPRWTYYLAHVYRNRNELLKAASFFERTLQLRPRDAPALQSSHRQLLAGRGRSFPSPDEYQSERLS
jgi:tetratricopeptide (TPR) repeat protein